MSDEQYFTRYSSLVKLVESLALHVATPQLLSACDKSRLRHAVIGHGDTRHAGGFGGLHAGGRIFQHQAVCGSTLRARAAARNTSGAGLPRAT